jgi:hypothetical protein
MNRKSNLWKAYNSIKAAKFSFSFNYSIIEYFYDNSKALSISFLLQVIKLNQANDEIL